MKSKNRNILRNVLEVLKIEITPFQEEQLLLYVEMLMQGLEKQRLMGTRDEREIIIKHIYDSLYPLTVNRLFSEGNMLDLGTGAGLPGIPLKICLPQYPISLLDSNRRKINFLRDVVRELGLQQVQFLHGRAEDWGRDECCREGNRFIFSRAVAAASTLVELTLPLTKVGGSVLFFKGPRGPREIDEAAGALRLCGGVFKKSWGYILPTGEERTLILLQKVSKTPILYPRPDGKPAKRPL